MNFQHILDFKVRKNSFLRTVKPQLILRENSNCDDPSRLTFTNLFYSLADCFVKPSRPSPFRVAFASLDGTPQSAF